MNKLNSTNFNSMNSHFYPTNYNFNSTKFHKFKFNISIKFESNHSGFGEIQPLGHLDVYLNGGKRQPGCQYTVDRITLSLIRRWAFMSTCSHSRAIAVFSDSLVSTCRQVAYECSSYSDFEQVSCPTAFN